MVPCGVKRPSRSSRFSRRSALLSSRSPPALRAAQRNPQESPTRATPPTMPSPPAIPLPSRWTAGCPKPPCRSPTPARPTPAFASRVRRGGGRLPLGQLHLRLHRRQHVRRQDVPCRHAVRVQLLGRELLRARHSLQARVVVPDQLHGLRSVHWQNSMLRSRLHGELRRSLVVHRQHLVRGRHGRVQREVRRLGLVRWTALVRRLHVRRRLHRRDRVQERRLLHGLEVQRHARTQQLLGAKGRDAISRSMIIDHQRRDQPRPRIARPS